MFKNLSIFALFFAALVVAGCGGGGDQAEAPAPAQEEAAAEPAAEGIVIEANDQLQFSLKEFTVAAGEEVTVTLHNVGTLPKETFGHNFVILTAGADLEAFATEAMGNSANEYLPTDMSNVLAHTALLGPDEEDTITFMAPTEPGEYEFLCTFPGHYGTMRGVMIVE